MAIPYQPHLELHDDYIQGVNNQTADVISRVYSNTDELPSYFLLLQKNSQAPGLSGLPTNARVSLSSLFGIVVGTQQRTSTTKQAGTLRSRQQHYKHKLTQEIMSSLDVSTRNIVFACYVASLLLGQTLLVTSTKVVTVKKYVGSAHLLTSNLKLKDPTRDDLGRRAPSIEALIAEAYR